MTRRENAKGESLWDAQIRATLFVALTAVVLATLPAAAKEYYVGEPVVQNEMKIVPHFSALSTWRRDGADA
jgi:hypothetical protein